MVVVGGMETMPMEEFLGRDVPLFTFEGWHRRIPYADRFAYLNGDRTGASMAIMSRTFPVLSLRLSGRQLWEETLHGRFC